MTGRIQDPGSRDVANTSFQREGSFPPRGGWGPLLLAVLAIAALPASPALGVAATPAPVDFNRDVRRILSENCFRCHGPDAKDRKGGKHGLRLDTPEGAAEDLGEGRRAVVPRHPEQSLLLARVETHDPDDRMPPPKAGSALGSQEIETLRRWISQGAPYARHWSYAPAVRPPVPAPRLARWGRNPVDAFVLARLEQEGLQPSPEADRPTLVRRLALDLTGLPPSTGEVDRFLQDPAPGAYERLVDRLLASERFGEHWARLWLDQARYADSAGYADDPGRTIWAYRDYVIRAFNANMPFDQFTLEQLAGDLLPDPTDDQLVATAFHRNTMTNNEGGTSDEEFRNVAVVDRVNTTLAVWMGTTMACAQCHDHKYDPIRQEDYFRVFAILNNTADADRTDEAPTLPLFTPEQRRLRQELQEEIALSERRLVTPTEATTVAQSAWENGFEREPSWHSVVPQGIASRAGAASRIAPDGTVTVAPGGTNDVYTVTFPFPTNGPVAALRLEVLPDPSLPSRGVGHAEGGFVLSRVRASITPAGSPSPRGRYLRVELPGKGKILSLAEVQVFSGTNNLALRGAASQSSTAYEGAAARAIDGNTDGQYEKARSTTHTEISDNPWWEVDLKGLSSVDRVVLWNRTDGAQERLSGFTLLLLDDGRQTVWRRTVQEVPSPSATFLPDGSRELPFTVVAADFSQAELPASGLLAAGDPAGGGWGVAPRLTEAHSLVLVPALPEPAAPGSNLVVRLEQLSGRPHATLARFRISTSSDPLAAEIARTPPEILSLVRTPAYARNASGRERLERYHLSRSPLLQGERERLASLKSRLDEVRPFTTVPVLRELAGEQRRKTRIQRRGNFLDLGDEVTEGLPAGLAPAESSVTGGRLALARWLVSRSNPLTARVTVNRYWESLFGIGIVRTSEEFGAQGELPSHPELLDWLAVEFIDSGWNIKGLLRTLVTSATYRQSSRVSPDLAARDPDNRLLARGPRFRLSAEMIRDQALEIAGLLSPKQFGPPVKPPQPKLGLAAAFGSGTDWETSSGEDRYRRGIYTTWRRSNPYPSMSTFDAPSREVCTIRRDRSNTPLQALVTLNDPVYFEAAQGLARRMMASGSRSEERIVQGFRLCISRPPTSAELTRILQLQATTLRRLTSDPARARDLAGGTAVDTLEAASWAVVANVLLNLDETLMKR